MIFSKFFFLKDNLLLHNINMYYNYHAQIRKLLLSGNLISYEFVKDYNGISPALVLFFKNHRPMPVREHHWQEYLDMIVNIDKINDD